MSHRSSFGLQSPTRTVFPTIATEPKNHTLLQDYLSLENKLYELTFKKALSTIEETSKNYLYTQIQSGSPLFYLASYIDQTIRKRLIEKGMPLDKESAIFTQETFPLLKKFHETLQPEQEEALCNWFTEVQPGGNLQLKEFIIFINEQTETSQNAYEEITRTALKKVEQITLGGWIYHQDGYRLLGNEKTISQTRENLLNLFSIEREEVKEKVLEEYIALLEGDPISVKSARKLVDDLKLMFLWIEQQKHFSENTNIQLLILKTIYTCLETVFLHMQKGNLSAQDDTLKQKAKEISEQFKKINTSRNFALKNYALLVSEVAKRIETNVTLKEQVANAMLTLMKTGLLLGGVIASPTVSGAGTTGLSLWNAVQQCFHLIETTHDWYEKVLLVKKMTRTMSEQYQSFLRLSPHIREISFTNEKEQSLVLFSYLHICESSLLFSQDDKIQAEAFKILLQHLSMNNLEIKQEIRNIFYRIQQKGNPSVASTACLLLEMLNKTTSPENPSGYFRGLKKISTSLDVLKKTKEQKIHSKDVLMEPLVFLTKKLLGILNNKQLEGLHPTHLVAYSSNPLGEKLLDFFCTYPNLLDTWKHRDKNNNIFHHLAFTGNTPALNWSLLRFSHELLTAKNQEGETPLHKATKFRHPESLFYMTQKLKNTAPTNHLHQTPLHLSILAASPECAEILVKKATKSDLAKEDFEGNTPLDLALLKEEIGLFKLLQKHGASLAKEPYGFTPTLLAIRQQKWTILSYFLSESLPTPTEALELIHLLQDPNCKDSFKLSHFTHLIFSHEYQKLFFPYSHFLPQLCLINSRNELLTPFQNSTHTQRTEDPSFTWVQQQEFHTLKRSVPKQTNVQDQMGNTLLHHLSTTSNATALACVEALLPNNDPTIKNYSGLSAIDLAILHENKPFLEKVTTKYPEQVKETFRWTYQTNEQGLPPFLQKVKRKNYNEITYEKVFSATDALGNNALFFLVQETSEQAKKTVNFILDKGVNPDDQNAWGMTPLHLACQLQNLPMIELLLQHGASPNIQDQLGNAPIHVLSLLHFAKGLQLLKNYATNYELTNVLKEDALHLALGIEPDYITRLQKRKNHDKENEQETLLFLLEHCGVHGKDHKGRTPLHKATLYGSAYYFAFLYQKEPTLLLIKDDAGLTPLETLHLVKELPEKEMKLEHLKKEKKCLEHLLTNQTAPASFLTLLLHLGLLSCVEEILNKKEFFTSWSVEDLSDFCFNAAKTGETAIFSLLPDLSVEQRDKHGNTLLHRAAQYNQTEFIKTLLTKNQKLIDEQNEEGKLPLMTALENGHQEAADLLLEYHPHLLLPDHVGDLPLHTAARLSSISKEAFLKIYRQTPSALFVKNEDGHNVLHTLAYYGNVTSFLALLEDVHQDIHPSDIERKTAQAKWESHSFLLTPKKQETPLFSLLHRDSRGRRMTHLTVFHGHRHFLRILLTLGLDLYLEDEAKRTLFDLAILHLEKPLIEDLLCWEAVHPNQHQQSLMTHQSEEGKTPLHLATMVNHHDNSSEIISKKVQLITRLLEAGASPYEEDFNKQTPLHLAASLKHSEPLITLLQWIKDPKRASVKERKKLQFDHIYLQPQNKALETPLHIAARYKRVDHITLLIEEIRKKLGSFEKLFLKNSNEETPIFYSVSEQDFTSFSLFIKENADIKHKNKQKQNLLHILSLQHPKDPAYQSILTSLLKKYTKGLKEKDAMQNTPLHYFAEKGHLLTCQTILETLKTLAKEQDVSEYITAKNEQGQTAADLAIEKGHVNIASQFRTFYNPYTSEKKQKKNSSNHSSGTEESEPIFPSASSQEFPPPQKKEAIFFKKSLTPSLSSISDEEKEKPLKQATEKKRTHSSHSSLTEDLEKLQLSPEQKED